jgi:hypothetical protein
LKGTVRENPILFKHVIAIAIPIVIAFSVYPFKHSLLDDPCAKALNALLIAVAGGGPEDLPQGSIMTMITESTMGLRKAIGSTPKITIFMDLQPSIINPYGWFLLAHGFTTMIFSSFAECSRWIFHFPQRVDT